MPPVPVELQAASHPILAALFWIAGGLYAAALAAALARPAWARGPLGAGVAVHLAATAGRGAAIGFFPLTNKMESFSASALALALVTAIAWRRPRAYAVPLLALVCAAMAAALAAPFDLRWPPPLMRTIWYPLHVPLSFLAYGTWAAAAAAALAWLASGRDGAWLALVDRLALWGLALWSVAMVTGGVWGVVAWGAWFMWDPKVIWSVILWFHYAAFVHLKLTPSLQPRPGARPALAAVGFGFVLVAYVGTSFFFGRSTHAFG
ncbi:MAG TPA: cytochrome c biogenesis protein CcsA [Anaeromyxobacteraceae bacterium]|nr:cytochrome c biogenesis protein CcsA [Anaeromyxobacteraceae bacterium]